MDILFAPIGAFLIALFLHIALWRTKRPKEDVKTLFIIFVIAPTAVAILYSFTILLGTIPTPPFTLSETFSIWLLDVALGCAYIQFYPAVQARSPSLEILLLIDKKMPQSTSESEIHALFSHEKLVMHRVQDLLNSKLAAKKENRLILSPAGEKLIRFFLFYRSLLGLGYNGG